MQVDASEAMIAAAGVGRRADAAECGAGSDRFYPHQPKVREQSSMEGRARRHARHWQGHVVTAVLGVLAWCAAPAVAQPAPTAAPWPPPPPQFRIDVTTYAWLASTYGELSAGRFGVSGNQWIWDADALVGAMALVEASYGRWRLLMNNIYGYQRFELNRPALGDFTEHVQLYVFELVGGYDIVQNGFGPTFGSPEQPRQRQVILTPYAGMRLLWMRTELDVLGQSPATEITKVAPIFGLRGRVDLSERWWIGSGGDIGGSGELVLTWSAYGTVGYRLQVFGRPASVGLGYRAIGFELRAGARDRATINAIMHGPLLGITVSLN